MIIYVFAGHRRRADVHEHLSNLTSDFGFNLQMHEFDLLRDSQQDVLVEAFWNDLKALVASTKPFCVIATPPCSTYSRARHNYKKSPGPRPVRSRRYPEGFPWLRPQDRVKAEQGTLLAERMWELFLLAHEQGRTFWENFRRTLGPHRMAYQLPCGRCSNSRIPFFSPLAKHSPCSSANSERPLRSPRVLSPTCKISRA